jgi:VIT1/CCC1 family predicted Fe2+/Mn2+ transporter
MPSTPHVEHHFTAGQSVRDVVIGMSDGLTVPFALAAGLSGAVASTGIIVTAGLAEIAAGAIAMGLGGYLAAKTDQEHYASERAREFREIQQIPDAEAKECEDIFASYGLTRDQAAPIVAALRNSPDRWVDFMMRFELGLEPTEPTRARSSALTIAASYIVGGLVPLTPYMLIAPVRTALLVSAALTLVALGIFGAVKAMFTGVPWPRGAAQTVLTGGLAAAAAFGIARLVGGAA